MKTLFDEMEHAVKNWWLSLILGILYIIVALCLLFAPGSSYIALSVIFSISMLISGIIKSSSPSATGEASRPGDGTSQAVSSI